LEVEMREKLRAVGPDEQAPAKKPATILEAASGSRREFLAAARANAAATLDDPRTNPTAKAALFRQIVSIDAEIRALDAAESEEEGVVAGTSDESWNSEAI
jgi:hypothetical protein